MRMKKSLFCKKSRGAMAPQLSPPPRRRGPCCYFLYSTKRKPFENYGKRFLFHLEKLYLFYLLFFSLPAADRK